MNAVPRYTISESALGIEPRGSNVDSDHRRTGGFLRGIRPSIRSISVSCRAGRLFLVLALSAVALTGTRCHRPLRPIFDEVQPPLTWPADPIHARVRYVGSLTSSADLKPRPKPFQGLVDLVAGKKAPDRLFGPRAVLVTGDGSRVWVADPGGRCLHRFDLQDRSYLKLAEVGSHHLQSPSGLSVGPDGTIFVCDSEAVAIHQLDEGSGALIRSLRLSEDVGRLVAIHYEDTGRELFAVDVTAHHIKVLDLDGRLLRTIGRRGNGSGEFNFPCDLAVDGNTIWVADSGNQRVQGLTLEGKPVVVFGEAGDTPGRMALPKAVATDRAGNVYVVDARFENVQIFDRAGNLLLVVGEEGIGPGQFSLPGGIFIDSSDRIWIGDTYNRRVQVFDRVEPQSAGDQ